jgi:hypothetical protein
MVLAIMLLESGLNEKLKWPSDGIGIHDGLKSRSEIIVGCGFESHLGYKCNMV